MPDEFLENPSKTFLCHRQDKMWNLWLSHQTEAGSIMIHIACVKYFKTNFNSTDNSQFLPSTYLLSIYVSPAFMKSCPLSIIITQATLRQAAGKSDAINRGRFLYICRALVHLS